MNSKYHNQRPYPQWSKTPHRSFGSMPRTFLHPVRLAALAIVVVVFFLWSWNGESAAAAPPTRRPLTAGKTEEAGKNSRVAIVTFTTEQKSFTHLSLKNHAYYAKKHGYDFIVDFEQHNPIGAMWHKFVMIEEAIATGLYDWVWWMDFDTLIMNTTTTIDEVVTESLTNKTNPADIDFILTPDCFQLNAGSFLTRGHARSVQFFDRVREYHAANATQEHQLSEQDCMRDIIFNSDGSFDSRITFVSQHKLNAFPEEIPCWDETRKFFERGMFAIHFAGAWAHVKGEDPAGMLMKKYESQIIW